MRSTAELDHALTVALGPAAVKRAEAAEVIVFRPFWPRAAIYRLILLNRKHRRVAAGQIALRWIVL